MKMEKQNQYKSEVLSLKIKPEELLALSVDGDIQRKINTIMQQKQNAPLEVRLNRYSFMHRLWRKDCFNQVHLLLIFIRKLDPTIGILTTDRKSTRLNSSHVAISYAVFCLKKK